MTATLAEPIQQIVNRIGGMSPLARHLELSLVEAAPERVVIRLPFRSTYTTFGDQIHGGAIATLIDTAATAVAWSGIDPASPPSRGTTVNLAVSYLDAARGQDLLATASVPRRGRSICFCHVDVHDAGGKLVAQGQAVYKLG
jgi:uncharacterized protein (TIGR00369 family)